MQAQNAISKTWSNKRRVMNPKRMFLFGAIYMVMAIAVTIVIATIGDDRAEGATLPDSLEMKVLQLEAVGKIASADSLRRVFTAQITLAARQKAAQDSLAKRQLVAKKKLWAQWGREVTPMALDSVWVWAGKDPVKAAWLSSRYGYRLDPKVPAEAQLPAMKAEMEARKKLRAEISRQLGGLNVKVNALNKRVDQNEKDLAVLRDAIADNSFDIKAALSVLERANLEVEPNQGNKALIESARLKARARQ